MKGDAIPDADHVVRLCKASTVDNGVIQATAFMLRRVEQYLSVNWLENLNRSDRMSEVRELQDLYRSKFKVGAGARLAVLNVGILKAKVENESNGAQLRVLHEPEDFDPSHAGIYGISHDDDLVAELIAQVVLESHPARA